MEEVIKERPLTHDEYWLNVAFARLSDDHDFYQLKYSFNAYSSVLALQKEVKKYSNLLFSSNGIGGLFIVEITNQNG